MKQQYRRVTADKIASVVVRLKAIADHLKSGQAANTTRLTILKRLCEDPVAAARFGLYLANRVQAKTAKKYKPLVREGIRQLKAHLAQPRRATRESLWQALHALKESQHGVEHHRWADIRIIHSREALLTEHALRIATRPWESAFWGYRMAAYYVERYEPRHGTGLTPTSLPALQDIIRFWSKYDPHKAERKVSGRPRKKPPRGRTGTARR